MVEGARLESVYSGNAIAGSNPALSAKTVKVDYPEPDKHSDRRLTIGLVLAA